MTNTPTPNLNGHHPAPLPTSSGAVYSPQPAAVTPRPATLFPAPVAGWSMRRLLYWLGWAQWGDIALIRWVWVLGVLTSIALVLLPVPGKWWIVTLLIGCLAAMTLVRPAVARGHFVKFAPTAPGIHNSSVEPAPLPPSSKIPIYVTGILDVSDRQQRFVALPGFYRTFATREHALLCQCADQRIIGIGVPPERDLGLWYAFFDASKLESVAVGTIAPGGASLPTLRIAYMARHSKQRGVSVTLDTLYISTVDERDLALIHADLLHDWPGAANIVATQTPQAATATKV